jgi:hypothetical protein
MTELAMLQVDLVRAAGVSEATVRPVMKGKQGNYRPANLGKIARALGWTADSIARILDGEDPIRVDQVVKATAEIETPGGTVVIDLPTDTEFEEGDHIYLVVEVTVGTPLADRLLSVAPPMSVDDAVELGETFLEAKRQGDAIDVKLAGDDVPAVIFKSTHHRRDAVPPAQLRAAAEQGRAIGARRAPRRKVQAPEDQE